MKNRLQNEENLIKKYQSQIEQLQREMNVVEQLDLKSGDRFNDSEKLEKFNDLYYCYNLLSQELTRLQTALDEANERLKRSVELPCKVGDTIYIPWKWKGDTGVMFYNVGTFEIDTYGYYIHLDICEEEKSDDELFNSRFLEQIFNENNRNKTWFTDKNKALEALKDEKI